MLVFYNFHQQTPNPITGDIERRTFEALTQLGETMQGILVLLHALVAYDRWPIWDGTIVKIRRNHDFTPVQHLHVHIADREHPLMRGMLDLEMVDETYPLGDVLSEEVITIVLTTDRPWSMHTLVWTRQCHNALVLRWPSGHGNLAWSNPANLTFRSQGPQWLASWPE